MLLRIIVAVILFALLPATGCIRSDKSPARRAAAQAQIDAFLVALDRYRQDTGEYPSTGQGLPALRVRPPGVKGWQGPYLAADIPLDPWGEPFIYTCADRPHIVASHEF